MLLTENPTRQQVGETTLCRWESALVNQGSQPASFAGCTLRVDTFALEGAKAHIYKSDWGREMTPRLEDAPGLTLAVTSGRSCHGYAPYLFVEEADGAWRFYAVCWPGNWRFTFTMEGEALFSMDRDMLQGELAPGERLPLPVVLTAYCPRGREQLCQDVRAYLRQTLPLSRMDCGLVSWNHWWRYEDAEITEDIVLANARVAAELGVNLIVLDAGWFGDAEREAHWTRQRGDWEQVNLRRFPHGLPWLADQIHGLGLRFGLWMEPEGMGADSCLRRDHPEWEALRDGQPLPEPYLCLGAEGAAEHLYAHMARLVRATRADWVKLDFNVNPGMGCNRGDHGHQPGLGLYSHLRAYLSLLDRLRGEFPGLIVENCSSGGMRMDLASLAHTDVCFLSDPDETDHSLQIFLSLNFLPPERLLHWAWSQTRLYPDGSRVFATVPEDGLASALAGAMLHPFGLSRDLTALTETERDTLRRAIGAYRREIAPMLPRCRTHLLTPPPLRTGLRTGDDGRKTTLTGRGCACLVEDGTRAVLMVYGLPELPPALPAPWDGAVLTPLLGGAPLGWTDLPLEAGRAAVYSLTMP